MDSKIIDLAGNKTYACHYWVNSMYPDAEYKLKQLLNSNSPFTAKGDSKKELLSFTISRREDLDNDIKITVNQWMDE